VNCNTNKSQLRAIKKIQKNTKKKYPTVTDVSE